MTVLVSNTAKIMVFVLSLLPAISMPLLVFYTAVLNFCMVVFSFNMAKIVGVSLSLKHSRANLQHGRAGFKQGQISELL